MVNKQPAPVFSLRVSAPLAPTRKITQGTARQMLALMSLTQPAPPPRRRRMY